MGHAFGAEKGKSSLVKGLVFVVTITGTMFCIGILTSHAANPITASLLEKANGVTLAWADWFTIGMPPALLCGLLAVPIIIWMWPPDVTDITEGQKFVRAELEKLGPMTKIEIYTLIVFVATLALWATDKFHKLNSTHVAILSVIAMIAPGPQQIMTWKEAERKVPWNVFIVYGAGLSMGSVLVSSGAAKWIAETFFYSLAGIDVKLQVVIFIWMMLCLQVLFTGAGPKTTALTPVIIAYAMAAGLPTTPFVILVGMNMLHQYLLPVSNLPNIIGLATEEITPTELIKTGAVMSIFGAGFMTLMVYTYWTWIGMFNS
jgi:anion transporter